MDNPNNVWTILQTKPFRLFFPLGILYGILGVGHWAIWSVGWTIPGISFTHASLQAQGFLGSFVVGFLLTAFPRMTGTSPCSKTEIVIALMTSLGFLFSSLTNHWPLAEAFFLAQITNLIIFAARRIPLRKNNPPSSFVLMGFGFLHAVLGTFFLIVSHFGEHFYSLYAIGRQMVQLGFLLCIVLGVTARLTPFLMGYGDDPRLELPDRNAPIDGKSLLIHGATGLLLLSSFFIEQKNQIPAWALRAVLATIHFLFYAKIARPIRQQTGVIHFFVLSCWLIILGLWTGLLAPKYRIAALHIVFIGGFSLMIFSFAMNVVYSHSAKPDKLFSRLIRMKVMGTCVIFALIFRVLADIWPAQYLLFIHIASGTWVLVALFWLITLFPRFFDKPVSHH